MSEVLRQVDLGLILRLPRLALMVAHLEPPLRAVERNTIPLEGHTGIERITHLHPVVVLRDDIHRVENVDVFAEDTPVTRVAVLRLAVHVKPHRIGVLGDVPEERAFAGVRAASAGRVAKGAILPVVLKATER